MIFVHCQNNDQAEAMRQALGDGTLEIGCLVDYMGRSFANDYAFGCAVRDTGGIVVDDPDLVRRYGNKLAMHRALEHAGLALSRTIIWHPKQPSRDLTRDERCFLGERIVCKPAYGSGSDGVILNMDGTRAALDAARAFDPDDHYLLQEFVTPSVLDGRPAWFRVYNCFGHVSICFWHPETHATTLVTLEELERYDLHELCCVSRRIAQISGYQWFSSEIALTERDGQRVFLPVDYLNNKCFMLAHSEVGPIGMPDALVETIAYVMVEGTRQHAQRQRIAA